MYILSLSVSVPLLLALPLLLLFVLNLKLKTHYFSKILHFSFVQTIFNELFFSILKAKRFKKQEIFITSLAYLDYQLSIFLFLQQQKHIFLALNVIGKWLQKSCKSLIKVGSVLSFFLLEMLPSYKLAQNIPAC
jgi:hypothetical protein